MLKGIRPPREQRAFDWVDYILYLLATLGFAWPTLTLLITGDLPSFLIFSKELGLLPNLTDEANQRSYEITVGFFGLFVVVVYLRNYLVMHRIDDRRDGSHYLFHFVDYNLNGWSRSERIFRALIVLWVLTTTIGAIPFVTTAIHSLITWFVSAFIGYASFQNMSLMQGFFTYYGLVVLVLFSLFIGWDVTSVLSIGRQVKSGCFLGKQLGPSSAFAAVTTARNVGSAIPQSLVTAIPVYALISYIQPRAKSLGEMDDGQDDASRDIWFAVRENIEGGRLLRLYLNFSRKFSERLLGLAIGVAMFASPFLSGEGLYWQTALVFIAVGSYLAIVRVDLWSMAKEAGLYFFDYFRFAARSWESAPCAPATPVPPPQPSDEETST